jgi:LPS-assembly protein
MTVGSRMRLDDNLAVKRVDVDTTVNFWRISGLARYFDVAATPQSAKLEGILWNGSFKFDNHWSAIAEQSRNIALKEDLRMSLGIAYQDDCSYFALTYERIGGRDRTLGPSESIQFRFALTGLGGYTTN